MDLYKNASASIEERLEDLLNRMTLEEMILQTDQYYSHDFTERDELGDVTALHMDTLRSLLRGHGVGSIQPRGMSIRQINEVQRYAVEETRLGIPILFSEEALHGFLHHRATCFPQQIGLAASFHPELGKKMGHAIASEARAMGVQETYSPVMDLIRDPRYGRAEESYGEDTYLCGEFARETVKGMQGSDLTAPDAIAAEPKHYVAYGAPVGGLNCAPTAMGRREVFSDCLPVFEEAFKNGGAVDAMCSYNSIDGIPVSADHELLTEVLRDQWGMRGFVRSDLTAIVRLNDWHFVSETREEAMAVGLEAGVDLQLYDYPHKEWQEGLRHLVETGRLGKDTIRQAAGRVLRVKFLLGLFDRPYTEEGWGRAVHSQEHIDLAREIARESMVLLKNEGDLLPLPKNLKTLAVLGPCADTACLGDYAPPGKTGVSVLDGIRQIVSPDTEVLYDRGCSVLGETAICFRPDQLMNEDGSPGLTGRYYNGTEPVGEPVMTRTDPVIDFNWIYNIPHPELNARHFSVAWTGFVVMPETIAGGIGFSCQDSMRLYLDGELILDGWGENKSANRMVDFTFEAGRKYAVRIEFTNDQRAARVIFGYHRGHEDFSRALELARRSDAVILCMGENGETCGENFDRVDLNLPGKQLDFVKAVWETGTPVVLLLQTGRPVTAVWEQEHIPAILEAWFPGEEGGHAVAETLFGDHNPAGHLPISFPRHVGQIPCHYTRRPGGGRRYVEMNWLPLYPFGHGLSYTKFAYSNLSLSSENLHPGESIIASVTVRNVGSRQGTAVPQLYLRDVFSSTVKPEWALCAFDRVSLLPGEEKTVELEILPKTMATMGSDFRWHIEPGEFRLALGLNAGNFLLEQSFRVLEA